MTINLIDFNVKFNKDLYLKIRKFINDLEENPRIKMLNNCNLSGCLDREDDLIQLEDYKNNKKYNFEKAEMLEFTRMKFLSWIFIKDYDEMREQLSNIVNRGRFDKRTKETSFIHDNFPYEVEEFIGWAKSIEEVITKDIDYLYNNNMGAISNAILKDYFNKLHPLKELLILIQRSNLCDKYFWLLIFFSMIRIEPIKDVKLEDMKKFEYLNEVVDFLVNSQFPEKNLVNIEIYEDDEQIRLKLIENIKLFQFCLREGYFNQTLLADILWGFDDCNIIEFNYNKEDKIIYSTRRW